MLTKGQIRKQVFSTVASVINIHPEYVTAAGVRWLATSITKRLTGQLQSLPHLTEANSVGRLEPLNATKRDTNFLLGGSDAYSPSRDGEYQAPRHTHLTNEGNPMSQTDTKITPDEHSDVVGGSTAGRVLACTGSVVLNQQVKAAHKERIYQSLKDQGIPEGATAGELSESIDIIYREETTSTYANEGTACHEAIAWILENDAEETDVIEKTFEGVEITNEIYAEQISPALREFDNFCDIVLEEDGEELEFLVERRCQMPGIPNAFGTSDIVGRTSKRVVIWDWKFGAGVAVSPEENDQLRYYARSALHTERKWFDASDFDVNENNHFTDNLRVDLVICQPRIGEGYYQLWQTDYKDLEAFRQRLIMAVAKALSPDAEFKQGSHCRWCDAKPSCPAKQDLAQRILATVDDAIDAHEDEDVKTSVALKAHEVQFTPNDLGDWVDDITDIMEWCKSIQVLARKELDAGRLVSGKKLVKAIGDSAWMIDDKKVDERLGRYKMPLDVRRIFKVISATQARKFFKDDEKKLAAINKIIERPDRGVKMVDEDAKGEAIVTLSETVKNVAEKLKGLTDGNS